MKNNRISLDHDVLRILKETYNVDLTEPGSIKEFRERNVEVIEPLHELEHQIFNHTNPNRKKRIPRGQKCSFCLKAENEVPAMAKHESGFNLCNSCLKKVRNAEKE